MLVCKDLRLFHAFLPFRVRRVGGGGLLEDLLQFRAKGQGSGFRVLGVGL